MSNNTTANLGLKLTGDLKNTNFSRTHQDDNWETVDEKYQEQLLKLEALETKLENLEPSDEQEDSAEIEDMKIEISSLKSEMTTAASKVTQLETEMTTATSKVTAMETSLSDKADQSALGALEEKVEELSEGGDSASEIATNNTLHYVDDPNYVETGAEGEEIPKVLAVNGNLWNPQIYTAVKTGEVVTITNTETEETVEITSENGGIAWNVPEYGVYDAVWNGNTVQVDVDTVKIYTVEFPKGFGDCTPQELLEAFRDGSYLERFQVGDTTDIVLTTGETLTFAIHGVNHDNDANANKIPITLGTVNLMSSTRQMTTSNSHSGYINSNMHTWLSGTVYASIPEEWRAIIIPTSKQMAAGNGNSTISVNLVHLFLFSLIEITNSSTNGYGGEGTQYAYYTTLAKRVKRLANGTGAASEWFPRTPGSFSYYWTKIEPTGAQYDTTPSKWLGVSFGFCIGIPEEEEET